MSLESRRFKVDAVIFDLDGTLIDSTHIYFRIVEVVFQRLGLPSISRGAVLAAVQDGSFVWERVLPNEVMDRKDELIIGARAIIEEIYPEMFRQEVKLIPGAGEILEEISTGGMKIGLVTSTPMRHLGEKLCPLKRSGLEDLLEVIITSDDVPKRKPAADPLIECGKRLGTTAEKSVYVGDSCIDIRAGKAAGMKTIGVLTGMDTYETLKRENPNAIIDSVVGLRETITFDH